MKVRHKRHLAKAGGGSVTRNPGHLSSAGDGGAGPVERDDGEGEPGQGGQASSVNTKKPKLVSGNPVVVKAAGETKSLGEVDGIYAKKRLDRKVRPGGISGG